MAVPDGSTKLPDGRDFTHDETTCEADAAWCIEKESDCPPESANSGVSASTKSLEEKPPPAPTFVVLMAICASLNSCNIGFDLGVSSGVVVILERQMALNALQIGMYMGGINIMAAVGGLISQAVTDRLGRRRTFTVTQIILLCGLAISATSNTFPALMTGRVIMGLAVGFGLAVDPLYIAEMAPAAHRGKLTSWPEIYINGGILLGYFVNWLLMDVDPGIAWRLMMACGAILPVALIILSLWVMPESPRWLLSRGRTEEASEVLRVTHAVGEDVASVIRGIQREIEDQSHGKAAGWATLLCPDRATRRCLLVGVGVAITQQINGSESVVAFSPTIFRRAGVATSESALFAMTMLVGLVKTSFVIVAACFLDTRGRRPLLIFSTSAVAACLAALSFACYAGVSWLSVIAILCFMATFSLGLGPITWLIAAEMFPSQIRAKAMSIATCANRLTAGAVTFSYLPLSRALGGQGPYFLFFAALTALTAVATCVCVPETKRRTLEQLHLGVKKGLPDV